MADNNQETSQASNLDQLKQAAGQLGQPHSNAVVPHKIANHDALVQASIWGGSDVGWINLNDTQDQLNMKDDLSKVTKVVQAQVDEIGKATKRANDAMDQANAAADSSDVNKAAIADASKAITEAQNGVNNALDKIKGLDNSVSANSAQLKVQAGQISIKADQTTVDAIKKTATDNSAAISVLNDEVRSKVDSTTVNKIVDGKGFTTAHTVQSIVDQKAGQLSQTITSVQANVDKNGKTISTVSDQLSNATQTIDGLQTAVRTKADQSTLNQLSNQLLAKVSTKDYQTEIAALTNAINLRVSKGDLISQINLEAGGDGLISVQNGKGKLMLDADSVVFGKDSKAFIPAALITNLTADQITTGTLDAAKFNVKNFSADSITSGTLDGIKFKTEFTNDGGISIMGNRIAWTSNTSFGEQLNGWIDNSTAEIDWLSLRDLRLQSVSDVGIDTQNTDDITRWSLADYDHYDQPGLMVSNTHKFIPEESKCDETASADQSNAVLLASTNTYLSVRRGTGILAHLDSNDFNKDSIFAIQKDNKIGAYFGSGDNGNELSITTVGDNNHITFDTGYFNVSGEVNIPDHGLTVKDLHVTHWLGVDGSKNSIVNTSQGTVAINAYETAEYYFGDIGENQTNSDGKAWVSIDYLFGQTVNTSVPYQVFITPYSSAHVWVSKRLKNRFLVESDKPSASFAWEIKAKRKGYEHTRLKNVDNMIEKPAGVK